jgi:hypothetical protein
MSCAAALVWLERSLPNALQSLRRRINRKRIESEQCEGSLSSFLCKPAFDDFKGFIGQAMSGVFERSCQIGSCIAKQGREPARFVWWCNRVVIGRRDEHRRALQIGQLFRNERHHRPQEGRTSQRAGPKQEQTGGNVCAIRVADREQVLSIKVIGLRRQLDEVGKLVGTADEVFFIKDSFRQPAEEARHTVFQDLAARAQQGCLGIERAADRAEAGFISASAMQEEERSRGTARHEGVPEIKYWWFIHNVALVGRTIFGRTSSICGRARSSQGGRRSLAPSSSTVSSLVNPGESVAISKSMPLGSRK